MARLLSVVALLFLTALAPELRVCADTPVIRVDASQTAGRITPWMYGSCIEDVNHEIYGGLYDQKIFGESFEEPPATAKFEGWTAYGGGWMPDGTGCRVAADPGGKLVRDTPDFADGGRRGGRQTGGGSGGKRRAARPRWEPRRRRGQLRRLRGESQREWPADHPGQTSPQLASAPGCARSGHAGAMAPPAG